MKVITLKQLLATLVAEGYKKYEFRTWKINYRGEMFIHAGRGIDKEGMYEKSKRIKFRVPSVENISKSSC